MDNEIFIRKLVVEGVKEALGEQMPNRYIDVSRIPLICQSIVQISSDIKEIKESMVSKDRFELVEKIVYGGVAVILFAVLGALVTLVIK